MKKKVVKITETDIKNMVNKLLKENHKSRLYPKPEPENIWDGQKNALLIPNANFFR